MRKIGDDDGRILIVLPLIIYSYRGIIYIESQACNGLRLWLENFQHVTLVCPAYNVDSMPNGSRSIDTIEGFERLSVSCLPVAYTPVKFLVCLPSAVRLLKSHIADSNYLHFAIGGFWGDWASIASLMAIAGRSSFAVWTDAVNSSVARFNSRSKSGIRKLYALVTAELTRHLERHIVRNCSLGLFHGMDTFHAYAPYCGNPQLVHDVHVGSDAAVTPAILSARFFRSGAGGSLRIVYAGRVHREKGVYDWIDALKHAAENGIDFRATWFGAGPELGSVHDYVSRSGISSKIEFPGAVESHKELLVKLKDFDFFLFCHKLQESPRCLIEALVCGLPIVGYESPYSSNLIETHGGGLLTPKDDIQQLSRTISLLSNDRNLLRDLSEKASRDGSPLTDEAVFRYRSELMKTIRIGERSRSSARK